MTVSEKLERQHQEDLQRLRGFRLLDDDFMTKCFEGETACTTPAEMHYNALADRVRFYKESKESVAIMCKVMEDMREQSLQEGRKERAIESAKRMLADGVLSLEKIAEYVGLNLDEVKKLKAAETA